MSETGKIRVGRIKYVNGKPIYPSYPNFKRIIVMMKSHSKWWPLSPYYLKNEKGHILENIWQFSKVYEVVPKVHQNYSRYNSTIIWEHPEEIHFFKNKVTKEYFSWRRKGFENEYAVRYPVGYSNRTNVLFSLKNKKRLDYISARKSIYVPIYFDLVSKEPLFFELLKMVRDGQNLLICEVDGPHQESSLYYQKKYKVSNDFIEKDSIEATPEILKIFLSDDKHPFGHGYCLAWKLLLEI